MTEKQTRESLEDWCKRTGSSLLDEWDFKDNSILPTEVSRGSKTKVWWVGKCGHKWEASINNRSRGASCPYCSHKRLLSGFNDMATLYPKLASEWNYAKNGDLRPNEISAGSQKRVWWVCPRGHEWQAVVYTRRDGNDCPYCSSEERTSFNEKAIAYYLRQKTTVVESYHDKLLGKKELDLFLPEYNIGIEYDGDYFHKNLQRDLEKKELCRKHNIRLINVREPNCPMLEDPDVIILEGKDEKSLSTAISSLLNLVCKTDFDDISVDVTRDRAKIYELHITGEKDNSLSSCYPELAKEWHPTKNGSLTPTMFYRSSGRKVWWMCNCGHEWQAKIVDRINGKGCPYCSNKKVLEGYNDLKTTNPKLASEWNYSKNGDLTPEMFVNGSMKIVWWVDNHGHEWEASIAHRNAGEGCPICTGRKVLAGFNDLLTKMPNLSAEWDYEKNNPLKPTDVTPFSSKNVWWICNKGHSWQTRVSQRTRGFGCPYCSGKYVISGENDLQTNYPALASEWHPIKNEPLTPSMIKAKSDRKVWWICKNGHEWEAVVKNRVNGTGCPVCYRIKREKRKNSH